MRCGIEVLKNRKLSRRKLTAEQVASLRAMRKAGATYKSLGELFGITGPAAYNIVQGVTYAETHPAPSHDLRAVRRLIAARHNGRLRQRKKSARESYGEVGHG